MIFHPTSLSHFQLESKAPNKYPSYTEMFYGTSASVYTSASVFAELGWTVKVTSGNPWTMEASIQCEIGSDNKTPITGSGNFVTVNWSYHYETTDKELLHVNADVISWINTINQQDKVVLDYNIANPPKDGIFPVASLTTSSTSISASLNVWNLAQTGTRTVPVVTPILRKSMVVPSTYNLSSFNTNLNNIYTLGTLTSSIGVPANWASIMPQQTDPSASATNGLVCHYGWLKQPPTQDQNGTTINIQQEWRYGLYPQIVFGTTL
jgi:hypothetical protein